MKWFERLFDGEKNETEELRNPIPEIKIDEAVEPEPKQEEKPIETFDVVATGSYTFDVIERENNVMGYHSPTHYIKFSYKLDVEFLGENIKVDSSFCVSPERGESRRWFMYGEEEAYECLAKMLEERDGIMDSIRRDVVGKIRQYIREKNVAKLKETLKNNNSFDINLTFKIEKNDMFKIK
jgi:hypothetical protein